MTVYRRLTVALVAGLLLVQSDARENATPESAKIGVREACTATTRNTRLCLEASLQYRCFNYGNFSLTDPGPIRACNRAVTKMLDVLDLVQVPVSDAEKNLDDPIEKSGLMLKQVLFATDLRELFRRPQLSGYFEAALLALQDSVRFGRANNLWDAMYAHGKFNRNVTLRIVGQAIQDVSLGTGHLYYLDRLFAKEKIAPASTEAKNMRAAGEFTILFQESIGKGIPFSAYPAIHGLEKSLHPYLHHFYLPAYIAAELSRKGESRENAFFVAFLLNAGYEFVKLGGKVGEMRWPFSDPRPFDAVKHELQARKIYTGYVGALWGLGLADRAESYDVFARKLAADPYGTMRELFRMRF